MYRCEDCGHLFEEGEEKKYVESHGENITGCPVCGGNFVEAVECKICQGYGNDEDYVVGCCKECQKYYKDKFKKLMDENFNFLERELLNELYDGEKI